MQKDPSSHFLNLIASIVLGVKLISPKKIERF